MTKREYDLIVVGAGPAGSSAAYAAAKNGIKVALLGKEENVAQTVRNLAYQRTATTRLEHTIFAHQTTQYPSLITNQRQLY